MADRALTSVPTGTAAEIARTDTAPALPPERHGSPATAPDLLAALDRGDDAAVWAWIEAHTPDSGSLLLYGLFVAAGAVGLMEWPVVALSCLGQYVVDRRFGGVENVAATLRARVDALTAG
ncbi:hypothetical protein [Actinomycetospora sp. TBRC 11914]|uniref:hypothetical protein n=1 Tax=Actinomycetospora sp. TBRC 11914 TaxID=2729387 RepID=UPI00145DC474|nr:hypothetical protein [Actinomycetospora sp. TBRC 11914]NMO91112.1 hypothetical protein [Actinomycetospora sp. TBRC 11914]